MFAIRSQISFIGISIFILLIQNLFCTSKEDMGGEQSKQQKIERYNKIHPNRWQKTGQQGMTQFAIDQNGREGQINVIKLDPTRKLEDELEVYYYRRTFEGPLVKCYGAEALKGKAPGVCGVDNSMKVITQRIIKRWRELPQLTFPEALYCLDQALEGYKVLYGQVGPFQVNHSMLGINKNGDLHVWLNQNFADNNPSLERGVLYTTSNSERLFGVNNETDMVDNIYHIIQQKCEQGKFPKDFNDQFKIQNFSFNTALVAIDNYKATRGLEVPTKIHPNSNMMYVSKIKGLPLSSNLKTSKYEYQTSSPFRSNQISPYRETSRNYSPRDANKKQKQSEWKKQKQFNLGNQAVFNTTYISPRENKSKQKQSSLATPKYASFGGNQSNPIVGYQTGGYQTGGYQQEGSRSRSPNENKFESKSYNLRENPNINAAQSIYQPKQRTPPPSWVKGGSGENTPIKYTQSGAGIGIAPIPNANVYSNAPIGQVVSRSPRNITFSSGAPVSTTTYTSYSIPGGGTKIESLNQNNVDSYKVGVWNIPGPVTTLPPLKNDTHSYIGRNAHSNTTTYVYKQTSFQHTDPNTTIPVTTNTAYTNPALFQKPKTNFSYNYTASTGGGNIGTTGSGSKPSYTNPQITNTNINNAYKTYTPNDTVTTTGNFILASGGIAPITNFSPDAVKNTTVTTTYGPITTHNKDIYSVSPSAVGKTGENIQTSQVTRQF